MSTFDQPPPIGDGPDCFGIGSRRWPGLAKLTEELGELQQVIGKIIAYPDATEHPDGTYLPRRLADEMGDVLAAIDFTLRQNTALDSEQVEERKTYKEDRFNYWHREVLAGRAQA